MSVVISAATPLTYLYVRHDRQPFSATSSVIARVNWAGHVHRTAPASRRLVDWLVGV